MRELLHRNLIAAILRRMPTARQHVTFPGLPTYEDVLAFPVPFAKARVANHKEQNASGSGKKCLDTQRMLYTQSSLLS